MTEETIARKFEATCEFIAKHARADATDAEIARAAVAVIKAFGEAVHEATHAAS